MRGRGVEDADGSEEKLDGLNIWVWSMEALAVADVVTADVASSCLMSCRKVDMLALLEEEEEECDEKADTLEAGVALRSSSSV